MLQLRGAESSLGKGEKESNYIFTEEKWQHIPRELSSQQRCHRHLRSQRWSSRWGGIRHLESGAPTLGGPVLCAHLAKTWPSLLSPSWRPLHLDDWWLVAHVCFSHSEVGTTGPDWFLSLSLSFLKYKKFIFSYTHGGEFRQTQTELIVESSDKLWPTGEGNGKPLRYSCLENPMNSMRREKDRTLKDELPRSVGAQYATGDQWRNNSRKNEENRGKAKTTPSCECDRWWK